MPFIKLPIMPGAKYEKFKMLFSAIDDLILNCQNKIKLLLELKHAIAMKEAKENVNVQGSVRHIEFDEQSFRAFKKVYQQAIDQGKTKDDVIVFKSHQILIGYAKYIIEYLEPKFKK